ncbi:MAG TPA: hypothetical protein VEB40_11640 [Flavipsychrobacter sp.]|nr:hypothetical protein [Flavipsychrobacter sp.]
MKNLDFDLLPDIPKAFPLLLEFGAGKYPVLNRLGYLNERINACYHFLFTLFHEKDTNFRAAYFRAALNEFVGISQIFKEYNSGGLDEIITDNLPYPLIHFFKLLRDVNFHITTIQHNSWDVQFALVNLSKPNQERENSEYYLASLSVIDYEDLQYIKSTRNAKHYEAPDLARIINWVEIMQRKNGINYLFSLAIDQYCSVIAEYLNRTPDSKSFLR